MNPETLVYNFLKVSHENIFIFSCWLVVSFSGLWSLVFGLDGRVVRVVDGDTIVVLTDDKTSVAASHGERTRGLVV
ncbi:hypothetical protein BMETH_330912272429, partial [methanotrophic bacterial endosymbiont of Bathymodiolus sp.]